MKRLTQQQVDVLTLSNKEKILRELNQGELIELFRNSTKSYRPVEPRKTPLDQQATITITTDEKELIKNEIVSINRIGTPISISAYIRNRCLLDVDIQEWNQHATKGLRKLTSDTFNEGRLMKERGRILTLMDNLEDHPDNEELILQYKVQLNEVQNKLNEVKTQKPKRAYRVNSRLTFAEANLIRFRASRLSLSVSDYIRFLLFDYKPCTFADQHLSVDSRKRFYVSIMDVARNGWGDMPKITECPNCIRLQDEISKLREQLARYEALERARSNY